MSEQTQQKALSASRIKTLENCSWLYWCNYHLKLPKTENDGARKGTVCHNIFELLLAPKHRKVYDTAIEKNTILGINPLHKLILKYSAQLDLHLTPEILTQLEQMILVGLKTDFFVAGGQIIKPEYHFDIMNNGPKYYIKGFIDKPAFRNDEIVIDDFKSSKKQFSGEDHESNVQALIYSLAAKKLWPNFKPTVRFIFLQYPDNPIQAVQFNDDVLKGFELYLEQTQELIDKYSEKDARRNFAADKNPPDSGEFKGKLLCGFAKKKGQLKKDGTKMWHCDYKFPFDYWVARDKDGNVISSTYDKNKLKIKDGETIELAHYEGCPRFNSTTMNGFEAPIKQPLEKKTFSNVLDDF